MNILFGVSHPKHVYLFKNTIFALVEKGHKVKVIAVDKEITNYLLIQFGIESTIIGVNQAKIYKKLLDLPKWEYLTYKISKQFNPDIFVGRALPHFAHVSAIMNKPFIVFEDTEIARALHKITLPFATQIVTPTSYKENHGQKHIYFDGYFELGYLSSKYFKPNPKIIENMGINPEETIIIMRLVSWNASHDIKDKGFNNTLEVVKILEQYGRVLITSETELSDDLKPYKVNINPEYMHHLLYYASLYIGESATMATESAVLGTPSIFLSTSRRGYTDELEDNYGLVYNFSDPIHGQTEAINKAIELLNDNDLKQKWKHRHNIMLSEKVDVTEFMVNLIEGYSDLFSN